MKELEQEKDDKMFNFSNDSGNPNSNNLRFKENLMKNNTMKINQDANLNNFFEEKRESNLILAIILS